MEQIELGIDRTVEILKAGVRRTAAFIALGLNASLDPDFNRFTLPDTTTNLRLIPDIPEGIQAEIKSEFGEWIQAAGFRELCESLEQYLSSLYGAASLIAATREGKIRSDARIGVPRRFDRNSVRGKLEMLSEEFGIVIGDPEVLASLWDARNCFSHRRGFVGDPDLNEAGVLRVTWRGFDTLFVAKDGTETLLPPGFDPFNTGEGGALGIRPAARTREFRRGERLRLSAHDLHEICWSCLTASDQLVKSLLGFAEAHGIPIKKT